MNKACSVHIVNDKKTKTWKKNLLEKEAFVIPMAVSTLEISKTSGTMIFSNYDRYEGAWENDKMEGKGEYLFYDLKRDGYSKSYKGDFHDGKIEGRGVFTSQKETFIGEWQRNIRHGFGRLITKSDRLISGKWKDGIITEGAVVESDGNKYSGGLKDAEYHGFGTLFHVDGSWMEGLWDEGHFVEGQIYYADGDLAIVKEGKTVSLERWKA